MLGVVVGGREGEEGKSGTTRQRGEGERKCLNQRREAQSSFLQTDPRPWNPVFHSPPRGIPASPRPSIYAATTHRRNRFDALSFSPSTARLLANGFTRVMSWPRGVLAPQNSKGFTALHSPFLRESGSHPQNELWPLRLLPSHSRRFPPLHLLIPGPEHPRCFPRWLVSSSLTEN